MQIPLILVVAVFPGATWGASRIVGGVPVSIVDYPYQLSLRFRNVHICGGAILGPQLAITAAHCLQVPGLYSVRAGSDSPYMGGVVVCVKRALVHPQFSKHSNDYDMALLFLDAPLKWGLRIKPVALPRSTRLRRGAMGVVTGWGYTRPDSRWISPQLRGVEVPVWSWGECKDAYPYMVTERMFCAGLKRGGKDSCQGDSGGPLVVNGTIFGIISFGLDCAQPDYPGVYTNVPVLREFIREYGGV